MTDSAPRHTILLLGNYRPALAVARSLHADGHRVWVSRDDDAGAAGHSRAVAGIWENPATTDPAALYAALAAFLAERPDITAVFPLAEGYVRTFFAHRHLLPDDRLYVMPNRPAVEICSDKARLLSAVAQAGLPVARHATARDISELDAAAQAIGFPLIVKPADSTLWLGARKALILRDRAAFDAAFAAWPSGHEALIVQTFVDGPRLNLYFAAQNGRPIRYLAAEIGKTDQPDGTGLATDGRTIAVDRSLREFGDRLIGLLDYHGIGCIQVLRDRATQRLCFLEINPRIGGNHAVTVHCGMDLDLLALRLAEGREEAPELRCAAPGTRYVWTLGALRGAAVALKNREIGPRAFLAQSFRALAMGAVTGAHMTFRWSDPMPSLALLMTGTRRMGPRLVPAARSVLRRVRS